MPSRKRTHGGAAIGKSKDVFCTADKLLECASAANREEKFRSSGFAGLIDVIFMPCELALQRRKPEVEGILQWGKNPHNVNNKTNGMGN